MSFATGESVGAYQIVAPLGSGGMATVYKAYHATLDRYVAIKVLHPMFKTDPHFLARFQREARIVAMLEHPYIVPVYDFSEHDGQPYLVMRFIEGQTLKARLQAGPLTISQAVDILRPVGQALVYAHEQGVLHRDVKPSNILLTPAGGVFLTDFGLAKMAVEGESSMSHESLLGTPQYISPEQARGQAELDARTDVYSLGVVLYELLVGRVPFQADTPYAVVHDHIFTPLPMPRSLNPKLPETLERVLLKALAKEREDRYASVAEMLSGMERAIAETPQAALDMKPAQMQQDTVSVPKESTPTDRAKAPDNVTNAPLVAKPKSGRKVWIIAGIVLALLLCCGSLVLIRNARDKQTLQQARELRSQGDIEAALAQYQAVRQANPQLLPAYTEPADALIERNRPGDVVQAAQLYEQAVATAPNNIQVRANAARAWLNTDTPERAEPHLKWFIEHKPEDAPAHAGMALVMLRRGEIATAHDMAQKAISLNKDAPEGHFALGMVYVHQQQPGPAVEQFEVVLATPGVQEWMKIEARRLVRELKK